ncbi:hypothetical protein O6H91_03G134900 [Diphasiastrum complanatum]|uniref:Uncharacterized protein n=1 Tax=Diphasiastrum complanatum TaxID=34168 RepID=A0ACC2ECF8_DIPCM|nr:hypothetical protein O6H91_03G134900 [Diphasiastrum complanatum]
MHDENVYEAFLEILIMYCKGKIKSISEVFNEVVSLLIGDHVDLLEEFTYFFPDDCTVGPASVLGHHSSSKPSSIVRRDDNTTLSEISIVKREKVGAIQVDRDRGFELLEEREKDREKKESELENELIDAMQRLTHKHETSVDELIRK